jgi:hypothetical protein
MKTAMVVLSVVLALAMPCIAPADPPQPPDHFELFQNVFDPFCPAIDGGVTDIRFMLPQESEVLLEVWNPDTTAVVRTLIHAALMAGYHSILWDGTDDGGSDLPSGAYPYSMTATDPDTGDPLFYDMLVATIDCTVATEPGTWGRIKAGFRGE